MNILAVGDEELDKDGHSYGEQLLVASGLHILGPCGAQPSPIG